MQKRRHCQVHVSLLLKNTNPPAFRYIAGALAGLAGGCDRELVEPAIVADHEGVVVGDGTEGLVLHHAVAECNTMPMS